MYQVTSSHLVSHLVIIKGLRLKKKFGNLFSARVRNRCSEPITLMNIYSYPTCSPDKLIDRTMLNYLVAAAVYICIIIQSHLPQDIIISSVCLHCAFVCSLIRVIARLFAKSPYALALLY